MEGTQPIVELLTKFSHCVNVLQFYGFHQECSQLMQQLCKSTFEVWRENETPFDNCIQLRRKKLIYLREFDEEFREFLMQNNRFEQYELTFNVKGKSYSFNPKLHSCKGSSKSPFYSIERFLDEVEGNCKMKIRKIYISLNFHYREAFNLFISKHPSIKPYCLFTGNCKHIGGKVNFINPLSCSHTSISNFVQDNTIETNVLILK